MRRFLASLVVLSGLAAGCSDDSETCDPADPKACDDELVCDRVQGQEPGKEFLCLAPVQIEGRVFDLQTDAAVPAARVSAVDQNGAPVGAQTTTDAQGRYTLRIPSERVGVSGEPVGQQLRLAAAARNYAAFPSGIRVSLPVDLSGAGRGEEAEREVPFALRSELTDVGLIGLPAEQRGQVVAGSLELPEAPAGALVVLIPAAPADAPGFSAPVDAAGRFTVFNVPAGSYQVRAFLKGTNYLPADVTVQTGADSHDVRLARATAPTATVSGTVSIVNAPGGSATSVVMMPASTFNASLVRGDVVPGLRAPEPDTMPDVAGAFSIAGVPDGRYVVLAAFENDDLVRDPDSSIGGTEIQRIEVAGGVASAEPSFKVTEAITLVSPGAGATPDEVGATPTFSWMKDSSAKYYALKVFDARGQTVWAKELLAASDATLSAPFDGAPLAPGLYQWRVTSTDDSVERVPKSQSEDLEGLFRVRAP